MFEIAWKEITARGRIVCKRRAFKSDIARETYIDQLIQKDSFYEIRLEAALQLQPARPAVVAELIPRRNVRPLQELS